MNHDDTLAPTLLTVGMAFAAGAALTTSLAWLLRRLRRGPGPVSDEIVARRVRAHAAGLLQRPEAVIVKVHEGVVRVSGRIHAEERERFLVGMVDVPGVRRVHNALALFPAGMPG